MSSNAEGFARLVTEALRSADPLAKHLQVRARGKAATIGFEENEEWVPLLRLAEPSPSFNVMSLEVRHHGRWEPTQVRGIPDAITTELLGPLRFLWQTELRWLENGQRTSDPAH